MAVTHHPHGHAGPLSRHQPFAMFIVAVALVVTLLPTSLRPAAQPPSNTAEFSPDAPPDENADPLMSAFGRGTSGTGSNGVGDADPLGVMGPAPAGGGTTTTTAPPPPRFCPNGYGNPPRQVESVYSAPCAAAWQGDNGGSTWRGVESGEIRVGVVQLSSGAGGTALADGEGPAIADQPPPRESGAHRTWRVFQQYFNQNFQLWGRRVQLYVVTVSPPPGGSGEQGLRNAVRSLHQDYGVFAIHSNATPALAEAAGLRIVGLGGWQLVQRLYRDHAPYLWSWNMDGTALMRINAEYICKRLAGDRAEFAGEGTRNRPRKFGLVVVDSPEYGENGGVELPGLLRETCDLPIMTYVFDTASTDGQRSYATAISQMNLEGVTTVAVATDALSIIGLLSQADGQKWFPEWFITGTWATDFTTHPALFNYSRTQWSHAFGLSPMTMAQRVHDTDGYRAYRTIEQAGEPIGGDGNQLFHTLLQIVNGLQMAGPELTPDTFARGLYRMGKRANQPSWTTGGGFGPGDPSYADDVAEIWWDPTAHNPMLSSQAGSYRYVDCGRRLRLGSVPTGPPAFFRMEGSCTIPPNAS